MTNLAPKPRAPQLTRSFFMSIGTVIRTEDHGRLTPLEELKWRVAARQGVLLAESQRRRR